MDVTHSSTALVAGRYRLIDQVGTGNMSTVYRGEDIRRGNRIVAIKLLNTPHDDELKQELFRRETKALEKLEHPNIITVLDYGWAEERQCYFLILEYLPHTLLGEIEAHRHDNDYAWCWPLMREMADALVHAHSLGVIHRDLKPSNILLTEQGTVRLTDFGISLLKFELNTGVTVSAFWSVGYASPEQRVGKQATERSDIYSLGCVYYHLLSGSTPPSTGITQEHLNRLQVPTQVKRMIGRMVAHESSDRFESALQLRRQLELTRNYQIMPEVFFFVTASARKALFDMGYINRSSSEAACTFLQEDLGEDVPKNVSIMLEPDGSMKVLTDDLRLVCVRDRKVPQLIITAIYSSYQPQIERQRSNATTFKYLWQVTDQVDNNAYSASMQDEFNRTLDGLFEQLSTHQQTRRTERSRQMERRDFAKEWDAVLTYQKRQLDEIPKLAYERIIRDENTLTFVLTQAAPDTLPWPDSAPIAIVNSGKRHQYMFVGRLMSVTGKEVQVAWEQAVQQDTPQILPPSGRITVYQQEALAALERQHAALGTVISGGTVNPRMPDVVRDLATAQFQAVDDSITFFQTNLAEDKQRAVKQALAADDLFLLQGPPGTGKTTTLAEIILQILKIKPDARILVSSQSNVAVNHILSRVAELREGQRTEIVRIGRTDKIGHGANVWTLDQRLESWRNEVLARTEEVVKDLKGRIRQQQRQRKVNMNLSSEQVSDLDQCLSWLEALVVDIRELIEEERMYAMLTARLSSLSQRFMNQVEETQRDVHTCEVRIQEKREYIVSIFDLIRSYLPENLQEPAEPNLPEERERLVQAVTALLHPGEFSSRETKLLDLVQRWRRIFGKQSDFAEPILERASILAATCLIAGGYYLKNQEFDWAIIDEAGRATAPELLVPLVRSRRAVIVGDERQLPPMLDENISVEALTRLGIVRESLEESLFATLIAQGRDEQLPAVHMLTVQHRMHPAIGRLVSAVFYNGKLQHAVSDDERAHGLDWLPKAVVWFSTTRIPGHYETWHAQSYYNRVEVQGIERLLQRMEWSYRERGEKREVAVITPYNAQIEELREHVMPHSAFWQALSIEIATIDAFQGRDRDIVLYSTVRSNKDARLGFLKDRRRLNVALSRARQLLMIVGDVWTLEHGHSGKEGNPYQELVRYMQDHPDECLLQDIDMEGSRE